MASHRVVRTARMDDYWSSSFSRSPIKSLVEAGVPTTSARTLLNAFQHLPKSKRVSVIVDFVRMASEATAVAFDAAAAESAAATKAQLAAADVSVKALGFEDQHFHLNSRSAAAFCEVVTYHNDPMMRRAL